MTHKRQERAASRGRLAFPAALAAALLIAAPAAAGPPPESARSREVEARIAPAVAAALAKQGLRLGAPVFLTILKRPGVLVLHVERDGRFAPFKSYPICTYSGALGPKLKTGDGQAPEGFYSVSANRMNPWSSFHLSFDLGYPNAFDRALGRTGSALMVHGACVSIGCYAMTDAGVEEIWTIMAAAFRAGQDAVAVHAFPFELTDANLAAHAGDPNLEFWRNLKEGADWFARTGRPPKVRAREGRYTFSAAPSR